MRGPGFFERPLDRKELLDLGEGIICPLGITVFGLEKVTTCVRHAPVGCDLVTCEKFVVNLISIRLKSPLVAGARALSISEPLIVWGVIALGLVAGHLFWAMPPRPLP